MKIVIDIPEELYKISKGEVVYFDVKGWKNVKGKLFDAVANGTPIPEGHGRLIDADELIKGRVENDNTVILVSNAKTIISADKGDE